MSKKLMLLLFVVSMAVSAAYAGPYEDLQDYLGATYLDPMAKDMGAVLGGGCFHSGTSLGLTGFDVGMQIPMKTVAEDNVIIKGQSSIIALPWVQLEKGLPMKIDLILRGFTFGGVNMVGYGVRYGILDSPLPPVPSVSVMALANKLKHEDFEISNISLNVTASIGFPIVTPYIGLGMDKTTLGFTDKFVAANPIANGLEGKGNGTRLEAGINLKLIPFTYLKIGGGYANGDMIYDLGFGVWF